MYHKDLKGCNLHIARSAVGTTSPTGVRIPSIEGEFYFQYTTGALWTAAVRNDANSWSQVGEGPIIDTSGFSLVLSAADSNVQSIANTIDQVIADGSTTAINKTWSASKLSSTFANLPKFWVLQGDINASSDFPTPATVQNGWIYAIKTTVTDNDPTKTNTGQTFISGNEIAWNGTNWTEIGSVAIWSDNGTTVATVNTRDIDLGSKGLRSNYTSTGILLSDVSNPQFNTTNKTITGSVNELKARIDKTDKIESTIIQSSTGFTVLTPVYFNTDTNLWAKAQANNSDTLATHIVSEIINSTTFKICQVGLVEITAHGKAEGYWFTSDITAGATVDISPVISNPVFFVQDANTIHVLDYRPLDGVAPEPTTTAQTDTTNTFLQIQQYNAAKTFTSDAQIIDKKYADDVSFHTNRSALDVITGINTGDETQATIKTKLGAADVDSDGYLSYVDWYRFNNKEPAVIKGNITETGTSSITITGGTNAVIGSGVSLQLPQDIKTTSDVTFHEATLHRIDFNTSTGNPPHSEGRLFYDYAKHAVSYYNQEADITVNLGQELLIPVKNETGSVIQNGSVVYPAGTSGNDILIDLALAADKERCRLIGMATEDIPIGARGYVTKFGEVGGLNTSDFVSGDIAYLSTTVPGGITKTRPTNSNYITRVGAIKNIGTSTGSIVVDTLTAEHTVESLSETGWSDINYATIAFTDGTTPTSRTLTISPVTDHFVFYQYSDKYSKTTDSIQIPDEEGMFLIYYNVGVLTYIKNPSSAQVSSIIRNNPLVAYVYWNATEKKKEYLGFELHKIGMHVDTHNYLHFAFGTRYLSGLTPNTISADASGDLATSAQFGMDSGSFVDEDIYHSTPTVLPTTGLVIAYLSGASASPSLRTTTNTGYSVLTTGTGRLAYNQLTGGNYVVSEVPSGKFALYHVMVTNENSSGRKIISFMGQVVYTTIASARAGAQTELANLKTVGILPQEVKAIATFIFETNNNYSNAVKSRICSVSPGIYYVDWRTTYLNGSTGGGAGAGSTSTIFPDNLFQITDNIDPTKIITFEASNISTGNTRIITVPDRNLTLNDIRSTTTTNFTAGHIPYSSGTNIVTSANLFFDSGNNRLGINTNAPLNSLDVLGTARFGDHTTNYSLFESDGTLVFNGSATVWNDIVLATSNLRPGTSAPTFAVFTGGIYGFRFDAGVANEVHGAIEIPHDYKEGSDLVVHVHYSPTTTNTGNIVYGFEYAHGVDDSIFTSALTLNNTPVAASGVVNQLARVNLGTLTGTTYKIGNIIAFRFYRQNGGTDTFTGNVFVHSIGVHYESDTVGSRQITAK